MPNQIVVAGALVSGGRLLVAQRARPPELAGLWELPGGKVGPGETDAVALERELAEELGSRSPSAPGWVTTSARRDHDLARLPGHQDRAAPCEPRDHHALRWVTADELDGLAWVPADRGWVPDLRAALGSV